MAGVGHGFAADIEWEVESPFRYYKVASSFALHEAAFNRARGDVHAPVPTDIVWRTERRLNDPDCRDPTSPLSCAASARAHYEESRLGWAAKTGGAVCYDKTDRPRHYLVQCDRRYSWGVAKEDYVLPPAHTVVLHLSPDNLQQAGTGQCVWTFKPRAGNGQGGRKPQPCAAKFVIERVPFSLDPAASGVSVTVQLPDGRELTEPNVTVEDLFVVAIGDSFASGESNPDRPVTFSAVREMFYDPLNAQEVATRNFRGSQEPKRAPAEMIAPLPQVVDWRSLPKRRMEDEERSLLFRPTSAEFLAAFERRGAEWTSPDCHRSQYGYPFRVSMELALEDRHRAITLLHLACSGAEVVEGLFSEKDAREQFERPNSAKVPAQFDQLSDLICRGGNAARNRAGSYVLPVYASGDTRIEMRTFAMRWCPPESRKRPIDVVMLSIGGNDVGFGGLAAYAITESAGDLAPIAQWVGRQIRFGPEVSRTYMSVLDRRLKAVRDALADGFGVAPAKVVQTSYEPLQFDETGNLCGTSPTLGLDVHPNLKMNSGRLQEVANFSHELLNRLECLTDAGRRADCPAGLATGRGTGFHLVTEHLAKFARRGICARDPARAAADGVMMAMPRRSTRSGDFEPYSPANALPYGHRWRLFHTPNDAFLTANTHREGISPFDILQPAYAGLYSGALHPTAEGHAIVADTVLPYVRSIIDKRR
jgi:hypothetical protein